MGINVNTDTRDFPVSIRNLATSLSLSKGEAISRVTLLQTLLCQLERWYELLCQGSFEKILEAWRKYEAVLGRLVEVNLPDSRLVGVAERIDSDGSLMVREKTGRLQRIIAGDILYCRVQ